MEDQRFILNSIVATAREQQVDVILVAGDIYDKASPSAEAVTLFDAFLADLASADVRVIAIPGNHDSAERIAYAQGLLANQGVSFPPVFDGTLDCVKLEDEHGPVTFWLFPFLKPGDVRRYFPDEEVGDDYSAALSTVLATCEIDTSQRNVALSHQLVVAGGEQPDRADDEIKLGGIDAVSVSLYDRFDYVALGHVHRPQRVGRDTVRYAGSPLKYSLSEARFKKSMTLVELSAKRPGDATGACVSFELLPLEPLHDVREVHATMQELIDSAEGAGDAAYDYLHVTLTDKPQLDAMSKIREVFPNALSVDYEQALVIGEGDTTRAAIDLDRIDTTDLFAQFFEEQTEKPLDDAQRGFIREIVKQANEMLAVAPEDGGAR